MVKILYLTGMFPYDQNLSSGIFVTRRIEYLIANCSSLDVDVFALVSLYNKIFTDWFKILPKLSFNNTKYSFYNYVFYKFSLQDYFLKLFNKGKSYLKISEKFCGLLKEKCELRNYNLIHAHFLQLAGFVANKISKTYDIPYIVTVHGSDIHTNPLKDKTSMIYSIKALEEAQKGIFISNYLLNVAKDLGYSGKNAIVIPNGVNTKIFRPIDKEICRTKLNINKKYKFVIGYVGNLIPIKGVQFLPKIFENIKKEIEDVIFVITGDGKLKNHLKREFEKRKIDVVFTGRILQEELVYIYNAINVLVVPSVKEGLSCTILEAQACGIPVVGSNVGGIPEAIGGLDYGRVVDFGKDFEKKFAIAVIDLLHSKLDTSKLRERAYQFDWKNTIKKEIEIYYELTQSLS